LFTFYEFDITLPYFGCLWDLDFSSPHPILQWTEFPFGLGIPEERPFGKLEVGSHMESEDLIKGVSKTMVQLNAGESEIWH
jgi:hypothetical protein